MAVIDLIKKDKTPIFKHGEKWGGSFFTNAWKLEGDVFACRSSYFIDKKDEKGNVVKDPKTGKNKREKITETLEYLYKEELTLLNIDGGRVFPIIEEESDVTFESEFS